MKKVVVTGGSGFIGLRYRTEVFSNMSLVSNTQTALAQPDTGDLVMTYSNNVGTAVINTDIIASISSESDDSKPKS